MSEVMKDGKRGMQMGKGMKGRERVEEGKRAKSEEDEIDGSSVPWKRKGRRKLSLSFFCSFADRWRWRELSLSLSLCVLSLCMCAVPPGNNAQCVCVCMSIVARLLPSPSLLSLSLTVLYPQWT